MVEVNVHEAKTHLSRLLAQVEQGDEVLISRAGTPIATLKAIQPAPRRQFGQMTLAIPDSFFQPLSDDELIEWEQG